MRQYLVVIKLKRLRESLKGKFPVTYEVPTIMGGDLSKPMESLKEVADSIDVFNIPNNPTGKVRIDPAAYGCRLLQEFDKDVIPHMTCRGETFSSIQRWLFGAYSLGVENVLVVNGDLPSRDYYAGEMKISGTLNTLEAITGIKKFLNNGYLMPDLTPVPAPMRNRYEEPKLRKLVKPLDFLVGAVILPERRNEHKYFLKKIDAGADFFQTQILFDTGSFIKFLDNLPESGKYPPVLVGTCAVRNRRMLEFMAGDIPMLTVPQSIVKRLKDTDNMVKESAEVAREVYTGIMDAVKDRGLDMKIGANVLSLGDVKSSLSILDVLKSI